MQKTNFYKMPSNGEVREQLRKKGQFWTPRWVAEAMVSYVLLEKNSVLFDPAVGAGVFFQAAKTVAQEKGLTVSFAGMEVDVAALRQASQQGLNHVEMAKVKIGDFILQPPSAKYMAIVANPPYIRHHRMAAATKELLKQLSLKATGTILDGRAGLHVYFLVRALTLLEENGRLAFIMPADTCEGKFAPKLWQWIAANYALDAVITFAPHASPFPNIDTNPLIFFIRKAPPKKDFLWAKCHLAQTDMLKTWVKANFKEQPTQALTVAQRELTEGLTTGLSRPPLLSKASKYCLGDFVQIMRGVATGANEFFFMTAEQVKQTGIPACYFTRAVGRTRDVPTEEVTQTTLKSLEIKGRPTFLLALNGEPYESYPKSLKEYLKKGESLGLPQRPLISQRKPWYKTEVRIIPPFLFAYLGRRNARFIRNTAQVIPLTGFLCVYPKHSTQEYLDQLWEILNHPETIANLFIVGKSYGDGAIKVEPRSLEKLPIPDEVIEQVGLQMQRRLFEPKNQYKTQA